MNQEHIPKFVILAGIIIHATVTYVLPWIGYENVPGRSIVGLIGMIILLLGTVLLFYYN